MSPELFGRQRELGVLTSLLDGIGDRGDAIVIRGPAGIGKSALVSATSAEARARGLQVLSAAGVESEANLPFAALHQLLQPVLGDLTQLPGPQRNAIEAAFGILDSPAPQLFLIALATLDLLSGIAEATPLLITIDDVQWLDRGSSDVLTFVARRIPSEPIIMVAVLRDDYEHAFARIGVDELRPAALALEDAGPLLVSRRSDLSPAVRERILADAAGNPLALVELPAALPADATVGDVPLPALLPLSERLEHAFAARFAELPRDTAVLLQVASIDDGDALDEIVAATAVITASPVTTATLGPALTARLVESDGARLRFRHPLVRSAIYQQASAIERLAAHTALARVLENEPERRVWHRAASVTSPDEAIASELELVATRSHRRGGTSAAVAALERAAELSETPAKRGARLVRAAQLAFEIGRPALVVRLVRDAGKLELGEADTARMEAIREMIAPGVSGDSSRVSELIAMASASHDRGDDNLALNLLWGAAIRCWWFNAEEHDRSAVASAAEMLSVDQADPRLVAILALTEPLERAGICIEAFPEVATHDPGDLRLFGMAAVSVGDFDAAQRFLGESIEGLRAEGRLGLLVQVLLLHARVVTLISDWNTAVGETEEAVNLAEETGQQLWIVAAQTRQATIAALRGQYDEVTRLTDMAEGVARAVGASAGYSEANNARGLAALSAGRYADAYRHFGKMFDETDLSYRYAERWWWMGDLAEAASHCGEQEAARALLAELEAIVEDVPSPWLKSNVLYARAFLAGDESAEARFREALASDLGRRPFLQARLQLAFGQWLRRQRRTADSRWPIRAARDTFDSLGSPPWSDKARKELTASGETSRKRTAAAWDQLSAQEIQIARMAADGLSNREIGEQLYLSHRTVGTHLYRIFPKLGITSRAQLHQALSPAGGA